MALREALLIAAKDMDDVVNLLSNADTRKLLQDQATTRVVYFCDLDLFDEAEGTAKPEHMFIITALADKGVRHLLLGGLWTLERK